MGLFSSKQLNAVGLETIPTSCFELIIDNLKEVTELSNFIRDCKSLSIVSKYCLQVVDINTRRRIKKDPNNKVSLISLINGAALYARMSAFNNIKFNTSNKNIYITDCGMIARPVRHPHYSLSKHGHGFAMSNLVMRTGRHYVQFTMINQYIENDHTLFGVIRQGKYQGSIWHCLYDTHTGFNQSYGSYEARQSMKSNIYYKSTMDNPIGVIQSWKGCKPTKPGKRIGMLLDLDKGTMEIYENSKYLGIMKTGLIGGYSWVAFMGSQIVHIESAPYP